jgi:hypothetical protein
LFAQVGGYGDELSPRRSARNFAKATKQVFIFFLSAADDFLGFCLGDSLILHHMRVYRVLA